MAKGKQFGEISYCKPVNGPRICKEYHGEKYEVESVEDGFVCGGLFYVAKWDRVNALAFRRTL
jgi:hypothetical protein